MLSSFGGFVINKEIIKLLNKNLFFCSHQIFILLFTFFIYASFHLSRKPISVVKVCNVHSQY